MIYLTHKVTTLKKFCRLSFIKIQHNFLSRLSQKCISEDKMGSSEDEIKLQESFMMGLVGPKVYPGYYKEKVCQRWRCRKHLVYDSVLSALQVLTNY